MKKAIASWIALSWLCLGIGIPLPVEAETVLERIQKKGILRVAIREDAPPLGYLNSNQNLRGYCLDFFALLKKQLTNTLDRQTLSVKLLKSTTNNRFALVSNNLVDLECGPNTIINDVTAGASFSQTFFVTGTQFLILENNRDRFDFASDLQQMRLGVVKNTTTEKFIITNYPLAEVYKFSGVTAKNRGIQAVEQGRIDAMVSDGILLRAEAQKLGLSASQYSLIPEIPLTSDRYGMILPAKDAQWQDLVNSVISSPEGISLARAWFGELYDVQQQLQKED